MVRFRRDFLGSSAHFFLRNGPTQIVYGRAELALAADPEKLSRIFVDKTVLTQKSVVRKS